MNREYDNLKNTSEIISSIGKISGFVFFTHLGLEQEILDSGRVTFLFLENQIYISNIRWFFFFLKKVIVGKILVLFARATIKK